MCEIQQAAERGWSEGSAGRNPFMFSSTLWQAYEAGRYTRGMGLSAPSRARQGRGYSIRIKPCGNPGRRVVLHKSTLQVAHVEIDYAA